MKENLKLKGSLTAQILNSSNEKLIKFLTFRHRVIHAFCIHEQNTNKKRKSTSQSKTIKLNQDQAAQKKSNPHKVSNEIRQATRS